jgi:hypothetical protein
MSTPFSYETVFEAPSKTAVLRAYFEPDHLAVQDEAGDLCERKVVDSFEDDAVRRCTWRVRANKSLPIYVRPFVEGGQLWYEEAMTWRKADDEIDLTITPQILNGRVQIKAIYALSDVGANQVRRHYHGEIIAKVKLLGGKIERGIASEIDKGMSLMTECTRNWLKHNAARL